MLPFCLRVRQAGGNCRHLSAKAAITNLREAAEGHAAVVLAIGSERGWSAKERDQFRGHGFRLAHLGQRPLRTETAAIASVSIVAAGLSDV